MYWCCILSWLTLYISVQGQEVDPDVVVQAMVNLQITDFTDCVDKVDNCPELLGRCDEKLFGEKIKGFCPWTCDACENGTIRHYGPYTRLFDNVQCSTFLPVHIGLKQSGCKDLCKHNPRCEAFHFKPAGGMCTLKTCRTPSTPPKFSRTGWESWSKVKHVEHEGYIAHPGKFWTFEQCPPCNSATVIESCRKTCEATDGCTAFQHHPSDGICSLRSCSKPIPKPSVDNPSWTGYVIGESSDVYPGKYWSESQCPLIGETPEICKKMCSANKECTAFHSLNASGLCTQRKCPIPVPQPTGSNSDRDGYALDTEYEAHPDKYWPPEQCRPSSSVTVIESCRKTCEANDECTVFEHNPSSGSCVMKRCSKPIPKPSINDTKWTGYVIGESSDDYPGKYWSRSQCPIIGETPEICKKMCEANNECTAFDSYNGGARCDLSKCPNPVPQPTGSSSD